MTTFDEVAAPPILTPGSLFHAGARLVGNNRTPCSVTLELDSLTGNGNQVLITDTVLRDLLRSDTRAGGAINIAGALFIVQHLAGLRDEFYNMVQ